MKKSLLALAVVAAVATSANAATVYDKDGTSLAVGGRVQAVVYNGKAASDVGEGIADHDAGLVNSARLNIEGNTKINEEPSLSYTVAAVAVVDTAIIAKANNDFFMIFNFL